MDILSADIKIKVVKADNNLNQKNFSTAKAILAALWHLKETGKDNLFSHKYIKLLCANKNKITHRSCLFRLFRQKLVQKDFNDTLALTEKGQKVALFAFIEAELRLHSQDRQKWDGGWRIVSFDIPESKRQYRDYLRKIIKAVGFYEFQKSIWIYPYPVPSFLKELVFEDNIKPYVRFITTNLIDNDSDIRKVFNLN